MRRTPTAHLATRLAAGLCVALLITGLGACGGDEEEASGDQGSSSAETSAATPAPSPEDESAAEGDEIDPAAFGEDLSAGLEALTTARTSMEITGQATLSMEGVVDYTGKTPAMRASLTGPPGMPGEMEMILLDQVMYLTVPGQTGTYFRLDPSDPSNPAASMGLEELMGQTDMRGMMEEFTPALTGVTLLGEEEIDGESLRHYRITMDPSKVESLQGPGGKVPETTYDAWFDGDFVMRRMVMETPDDMGTMTMRLFDLGTDVTIQAPPAEKIIPMPGG